MNPRLHVRIEITPAGKQLLPWVVIARPGRQTVDSHFFAIMGYPDAELFTLDAPALERAHNALETALRLASAFEYIPHDPEGLETFFEKRLVTFEQKLNEHAADAPALHMAIGMVSGTKAIFATSGDLLALQLTESSITNLGDARGDAVLHFGSLHSGVLTAHAYLLFVPKSMGTLLKSDELKGIALARSSERKLEYLEHIWGKRSAQTNTFRGVLLEAKPQIIRSSQTTAISIAHMLATESKTEDLLSPPLLRPFITQLKEWGARMHEKLHTLASTYRAKLSASSTTPVKPLSPRYPNPPALPKAPPLKKQKGEVSFPSRTVSSYLLHGVSRLRNLVEEKRAPMAISEKLPAPQEALDRIKMVLPRGGQALINRFNGLPLKSKTLLIIIITLVFLFAQGILITREHAAVNAAQSEITGEVTAIQTLADAASASLIYGDEPKAQEQLQEVQRRIVALPDFTRASALTHGLHSLRSLSLSKSEQMITTLKEALKPLEDKLRHRVVVATPGAVAEALRANLALSGNTPLTLLFHKREYELKPGANQIYKQEPIKGGFGPGTPWIKDGTDVRSGTSFTIDGTLYVGDAAGHVTALRKGARFAFDLKPIDPPLAHAGKIWTNEDSDYLYMLDPSEKRLLAFVKKTGLLRAQYVSPTFTDLKDFAIDEHAKMAYLLDGATVVSVPLSHFGK